MTQYLRRLSSLEVWAELSQNLKEEDFECPPGVIREVVDPHGLSVYEVTNSAEQMRVIAALMLSSSRPKETHAILLEDSLIKKTLGLRVDNTDGQVFDPVVKKLHRDVKGLSYKRIRDFVLAISNHGKLVSFSPQEIIRFVLREIDAGRMQRSEVFRNTTRPDTASVMHQLWLDRFLELNHP